MVVIVFRTSLEMDILNVLEHAEIASFTDIPDVHGTGTSGGAFHSFEWRGTNNVILAAADDAVAERLVQALLTFRDERSRRQGGVPIPLHAFVFGCAQVL